MNVSIKQLRGFIAIAETGSFAEASERLYITQPALCIAIGKLEDTVGGLLFNRSTRSVQLTPEGLEFLPIAQRLIADWSEAFDDLNRLFSLRRGKLTVAAMPSFASTRLPAIVAEYQQQFPNITIAVQDIVMEQVIDAVQTGRADLGITFEPDNLQGQQFESLFTDRFVAVMPMSHALSGRKKIEFSQLLNDTLIVLNRGSSTRRWTDQLIQKTGVLRMPLLEAFQLTTVGAMVAAGVGVAVVPALCQQQMESLGAYCCDISGDTIERRVGVLSNRRYPLSSAAARMLALLRGIPTHK